MRVALIPVLIAIAIAMGPCASEAQTLDEVTVEGTRYTSKVTLGKTAVTLRQIPNSVSVITEQRIQDQNLITVADALANVTGVTAIPNDSAQSQYRTRGYALSVMYDGIPSYSSLGGYQQLDLAIYERLEVLRGPAGLLQGSSDPGGVLNLVRKRGREEFHAAAALTAARWNKYRAVVDVTGPMNSDQSIRGRAVAMYQDGDDFVDITRGRQHLVYGTLDWDITATTTLNVFALEQDAHNHGSYSGLPSWTSGEQLDVPRSTNAGAPWQRDRWKTRNYGVEVIQHLGKGWSLTARGSRRDQDQFFHDAYTTTGVQRSDYTVDYGRREFDYDYERQGMDVFLSGQVQVLGRSHSLLAGYNVDSFDRTYGGISLTSPQEVVSLPFDQRQLLPDFSLPYDEGGATETRQDGFYAQTRVSLADPLTVVAGIRLSDFNVRSRNLPPSSPTSWRQGDRVDDKVTPFGGAIYDLNQWLSLYGSYSSVFIPQSTLLRVEPRSGRQYEVGAKAEFLERRLNASIALFNLRDQHRALADINHPGFSLNAGEVESKGWEMEITGSPAPGFELQAGYARLDTTFVVAPPRQQGTRFSIFEPKHSWRLWAVRRFERADTGWTVGVGCNGQSSTEFDPPRSQGTYTVVDVLAGYRVNSHWSVNLNVSNVLDKVYYSRLGGVNSYNTFGEPRNYSLTVRYSAP
jgi:outer membrane receptor for ferric coprogen and ferric-rhodotorulic acid